MMRGVVLFAHNNESTDYYAMASYTAHRVEKFLHLPVTVITDDSSITTDYAFDNIIKIQPDTSNYRSRKAWFNKGRYLVYDLSPYTETLLLDTDYMINSNRMLELFDNEFCCYSSCKYFFSDVPSEVISRKSFQSLWATVVKFSKSNKCETIFKMLGMIQNNYEHYGALHNFLPTMYRNDYALTLALRISNGQIEDKRDYIHGNLLHVGLDAWVERLDDTTYKIYSSKKTNGQHKLNYIIVRDTDFHMLHKQNFMELVR